MNLKLLTHDVAIRAYKTFVEATVAQATLYGTVIPDPPAVKTSATISVSAAVVSVAWNLGIQWFLKTKNARLDKLAAAIDSIVDARLKEQGQPDPS